MLDAPYSKIRVGLMMTIAAVVVAPSFALAQTTTLTMSSWVPPSHGLTKDMLPQWAAEVEKATKGRVKLQMLAKHPSAPPGTFDAVKDGLVDVSLRHRKLHARAPHAAD